MADEEKFMQLARKLLDAAGLDSNTGARLEACERARVAIGNLVQDTQALAAEVHNLTTSVNIALQRIDSETAARVRDLDKERARALRDVSDSRGQACRLIDSLAARVAAMERSLTNGPQGHLGWTVKHRSDGVNEHVPIVANAWPPGRGEVVHAEDAPDRMAFPSKRLEWDDAVAIARASAEHAAKFLPNAPPYLAEVSDPAWVPHAWVVEAVCHGYRAARREDTGAAVVAKRDAAELARALTRINELETERDSANATATSLSAQLARAEKEDEEFAKKCGRDISALEATVGELRGKLEIAGGVHRALKESAEILSRRAHGSEQEVDRIKREYQALVEISNTNHDLKVAGEGEIARLMRALRVREEGERAYSQTIHTARDEVARLTRELADWECSFELYNKAELRAIELWHEAGGDEMVWPDKAKLTVWLLEQLAAARTAHASSAAEVVQARAELAQSRSDYDASEATRRATDEALARARSQRDLTQGKLDQFMGVVADQSLQIMELRGELATAIGGELSEATAELLAAVGDIMARGECWTTEDDAAMRRAANRWHEASRKAIDVADR